MYTWQYTLQMQKQSTYNILFKLVAGNNDHTSYFFAPWTSHMVKAQY